MKKQVGMIILGLGTALMVALAASNGASVALNCFGAKLVLPEGVEIIVSYALGVVLTFALLASRFSARTESNRRLTDWQAQDEKLEKQVQSDREKQLEAKIATLEAALQRALKKS